MADSPRMLYSLQELGRALDQAAPLAAPAPAVRVVQLPDVLPARRARAKAERQRETPAEAVVIDDPLVLQAPPRRRRRAAVDWKLVFGVSTAASVLLGVTLFAAWVTTPRAPKPLGAAQPAPVASLTMDPLAAAPAVQEPTVEERVAALEKRHQDEMARLQARLEQAEKPAPREEPVAAPVEEPRPAPKMEPVAAAAPAADEKPGKINYGTAVDFVNTPAEANDQAVKQKKLVLILTISGNFEESCFT